MADEQVSKGTSNGNNNSRTFFIIGIVLLVGGIILVNAVLLAVGVIFLLIGLVQRQEGSIQKRIPTGGIQIDEAKMYKLYINDSDTYLGEISGKQLNFLVDNLEEEFLEDHDYAITRLTIDYLASKGADPALVDMLNKALADAEEITIIWKRS